MFTQLNIFDSLQRHHIINNITSIDAPKQSSHLLALTNAGKKVATLLFEKFDHDQSYQYIVFKALTYKHLFDKTIQALKKERNIPRGKPIVQFLTEKEQFIYLLQQQRLTRKLEMAPPGSRNDARKINEDVCMLIKILQ